MFGALSLLLALAIVGILAKKQLNTAAPVAASVPARAAEGTVPTPSGTPLQQVQQFQQAVQGAMQQARPMPDDK